MSAFEIFQDELRVAKGAEVTEKDGLASDRSSSEAEERADSGSESHHVPGSISLPVESSPNNCVASNSALTGSSSISSRNRGVSGIANRNNNAITPGTTPRPMI